MLLIPIFVPIIAGFALLFLPSRLAGLHKLAALVISILALVMAVKIFSADALSYSYSVMQIDNLKLDLLLASTALNKFILLFAMGFGVAISLYSLKSGPVEGQANTYFGSLLLAIGGSAGILLSNHLVFLLMFWEVVTFSLYFLIVSGGKDTKFAATKSFAMLGASDGAFLLGLAMVWVLSGTFVISDLDVATNGAVPIIAFLLLLTAAITKAGAMPLHTWLPTSGESTSASVMAILPAALDKLLGIYLLVLIVKEIFLLQSAALSITLAVIGAATIIIAVMVAMVQHNMKKLLSYHAISQVGYMVLGIATLTPVGIAGGLFHMLNHAIYKCCLFLCGGAVEKATGTAELDNLGGLGKKMPWTFGACLIASLSISGIPPFNGFVSKWMVYQGIVQMGAEESGIGGGSIWPVWLLAAMFGSALTLASFVKIIHSVFLSRLRSGSTDIKEVPYVMVIPMVVLAALCVLFGVLYHLPLKHFIYPALGIEGEVIFGTWESGLATFLIIVGILIGFVILLIGLASRKSRVVPTWTCGEKQDNDEMIIPGTGFYKTISSMRGLKQLYKFQEKGYFDLYDQGGRIGMCFSNILKWLHSGVLPMYLTWVTLGLLIILMVICDIW